MSQVAANEEYFEGRKRVAEKGATPAETKELKRQLDAALRDRNDLIAEVRRLNAKLDALAVAPCAPPGDDGGIGPPPPDDALAEMDRALAEHGWAPPPELDR